MQYDAILEYTRSILKEMRIQTFISDIPPKWDDAYDGGLRRSLFKDKESILSSFKIEPGKTFAPHTITFIIDMFDCEYFCLRLPDTDPPQCLFSGAFSTDIMTNRQIEKLCQRLKIPGASYEFMARYYSTIPSGISDLWLKAVLESLAKILWGGPESFQVQYFKGSGFVDEDLYDRSVQQSTPKMIDTIEHRYRYEKKLMSFITDGNWRGAEKFLSSDYFPELNQRTEDTVRDKKNNMIILNTLCRKAAEAGQVDPVHLDEISSRCAAKIESAVSSKQVSLLDHEMIKQYCELVHSYSVRGYSPTIQRAIQQISIDLTSDLSLHALSQKQSINSSYLSAQFKKETGITLTAYVNQKRILRSKYLLRATSLSIQEIAVMCGIPDLNYFTKVFKKQMEMTPSEYRETHPMD